MSCRRQRRFIPRPPEMHGNVRCFDFGVNKDFPRAFEIDDCRINTLIELLEEAKKHHGGNAVVSIGNRHGAKLYFTNISTHLEGSGSTVEW